MEEELDSTPSSTSASTSSMLLGASSTSARANLEEIVVVWYDANIANDEDTAKTIEKLRALNDYLVVYRIENECISYVTSIKHEKIFFITSGRCAEHILNQVHNLKSIDSVFIFCYETQKYQHLSSRFSKLVGVFNKRFRLFESVEESIRLAQKQMEVFSFYDQHVGKSTRDLSKEAAGFLWFQMFKDMIMRLPRTHNAKRQMIDFCRNYYRGNEKELRFIEKFEQEYTSDKQAIAWYTEQTFLFRLVNKALRTEDIEQLHIFRFYIADLSSSLAEEHRNGFRGEQRGISLYRGLHMDKEEFLLLKQNEGNLVSTNGFLSTTRLKEVALSFAKKPTKGINICSVLFEIECDLSELGSSIAFADVSKFSAYPNEAEVLFDIGATFRILSVEENGTNPWSISMKAVNEGMKMAEEYIALNRKEEEETSPTLIFGKLMLDMGLYDQSLRYFENLLVSHAQGEDTARIHNSIGRAYLKKGDYNKAMEYCERAYTMMMEAQVPREKDSASPLVNIGLIHHKRKAHWEAIESYFKALQIFEKYYGTKHLKTATVLTNIGNSYVDREQYHIGLGYFEEVLAIQQQFLPPDHMETAMTLNNIAVVYQKLSDGEKALEYYEKSLVMKQRLLPADHPDIIITLENIQSVNHSRPRLQYASKGAAGSRHGSRRPRSPQLHHRSSECKASGSSSEYENNRTTRSTLRFPSMGAPMKHK